MSRASLSRSTRPSPFGKRTSKAQTLLAPLTKEKLAEVWRGLGYKTEGEFLAELIEIRVHGQKHVESLLVERVRRVAGIG